MAFTDDDNTWYLPKRTGGRGGSSSISPWSFTPLNPGNEIVLTPGYVPDYESLIKNSGLYKERLAQSAMDVKQAAANRKEILRQLAIRYGGLPSGFKDEYGDIDKDTLKLASQNVSLTSPGSTAPTRTTCSSSGAPWLRVRG